MKDLINKIPITTILISYFFICGGLYIIGFWTTFEIDISSFLSLADIPKSFILPFVFANGFFVLNLLVKIVTASSWKGSVSNEPPSKVVKFLWFLFDISVLAASTVAIIIHENNSLKSTYWITFATIFTYCFIIKFITNKRLQELIPTFDLRLYLGSILITLPISCFTIGKVNSLKIYHNENVMELKQGTEHNPNECLKLLGFIGDKVIVSSFDNKRILFINQSSKDKFELTKTGK